MPTRHSSLPTHRSSAPAQSSWDRKHLLALEGLSASDITSLLNLAQEYREVAVARAPRLSLLAHRTIANLFFESSTRTRCSFTLAARRLGADTLDISSAGSSISKGETILDTALNLQAMGVHALVLRSSASGAAVMLANAVSLPVINAGDGKHEHPTQGLLDLLTLRQHFGGRGREGDLRGKTIGIVGDAGNSRVARSNIHGLTTLGANVILVGPPTLVPKSFEKIVSASEGGPGKVSVTHDLDDVLPRVDALIMLRVQFERIDDGPSPIPSDYRQLYGLSALRASQLPDHAIIMHPGPMNRGLEIDSEVADDPERSAILQQVANGVAVRMAVLATLLKPSSPV
ncbi:MAG: aspartate carbamoyltransferase catalytic subunit [Phycisphaerales bacterium]|nr:aspartate carbamoyltransferase catalytic subunit [Phycisphaerales bacterium]